MGLLSIFQRNKQTSAKQPAKARGGKSAARQAPLANTQNSADTAEAVREARARARRRLMGATVLLLVGVIGFPLLFETQPRPIPVDLPIEIPARNAPGVMDGGSHAGTHANAGSAAALVASGPKPESVSYDARPSAPTAASEPASAPTEHRSAFASLAAALTSSTPGSGDAAASTAAPASASSTVAQTKPAAKPGKPVPASAAYVAPASKPVPHVVLPPPVASTPSPAAILAGAPTPAPKGSDVAGGRFVVQVGAFLEDAKVREARTKVEKLGLKTYTQPVDTPTGKRIRVRVGPYATKAEADKIAARIKAEGQLAVVLAL